MTDPDKVYKHKVSFYCPRFICTNGGEGLCLRTATLKKDYPVEPLQTVSTIGAGDNFNAGVVYGLWRASVVRGDMATLSRDRWNAVMECGLSFSAHACTLLENYIDKEWAAAFRAAE